MSKKFVLAVAALIFAMMLIVPDVLGAPADNSTTVKPNAQSKPEEVKLNTPSKQEDVKPNAPSKKEDPKSIAQSKQGDEGENSKPAVPGTSDASELVQSMFTIAAIPAILAYRYAKSLY